MTVLIGARAGLTIGQTIVEREIGNVMIALQLLQHVVSADLPAFINRMK
jgi:hypothetical protein